MLALARLTGRREGAICQLRADDVLRGKEDVSGALAALGLDENAAEHFPHGGIRWRGETDKVGLDSVTPLNTSARGELDRYLERNPRIGDVPLFPSPRDPEKPFRGDLATKWLLKAERLAKLPKLAGGTWHPFRRLFAIELRALPVHDVAAAGGWRSVQTVQQIYQRAEPKGVLGVIEKVGTGA
jgi:integrase